MELKEFVMSEVSLLKKEAKSLSTTNYISMANSNSSDPPSDVANECLLKKLEKEQFLRVDLQNKNIIVKIFH